MRIVVSGASGFIGRACLRVAAGAGHEVLALSRRADRTSADGPARWVVADLDNPASYATALADFCPEVAIHLAWDGIPDYSLDNSLKNLASGARFAEQVFQAGCRRLVAGGSCWEYGDLEGPVRESDRPRNVGIFGACKTAQREVLAALANAAGASLAWARIFYAFGPGQKSASLAPSLCADLLAGRPPEPRTPLAVNDFIYVDDVASALVTLAEVEAQGVFNLGSGIGVAVADFANILARVAGGPAFASPTGGPGGNRGSIADLSRMTALDWAPRTPLETGVEATWSWFRREHCAPC